MINTFPLEEVNALRSAAVSAGVNHEASRSALWSLLCEDSWIFEDTEGWYKSPIDWIFEDTEGWYKSPIDPMNLLRVFSSLHIKPGYVLRAYQSQDGLNGIGIVWALKADAPFPEPSECLKLREYWPKFGEYCFEPPKPHGALDNYMEAIEGDGTPWSYLSASLFAREAAEFGAMWHGCSWTTHEILGEEPVANSEPFEWSTAKPDMWLPSCYEEGDTVIVQFYTLSALGYEAIIQHRDIYQAGEYVFRAEDQVIATGGEGYVF